MMERLRDLKKEQYENARTTEQPKGAKKAKKGEMSCCLCENWGETQQDK